MSIEDEIEIWRKKIDELDVELTRLLNERTECAIEIGRVKARHQVSVYDPKREEQVISNVQEATRGLVTKEAVRRIFERIIDETRRAERETMKDGG